MAEMVTTIKVDDDTKVVKTNAQGQPKRPLKRKRPALACKLTSEQKKSQIEAYRKEIEGLARYFREIMLEKRLELTDGGSLNAMVAMLLQERCDAYSRLTEEILEKVRERLGDGNVTIAKVKTAVLYVGQRLAYGVPKADADILEDETEACLWCWETREVKLMPTSVRAALRIRRTCRKKISERINAVSGMIAALQKSEYDQTHEKCLINAMEKLAKVLSEAQIRLLVDGMLQKSGAEFAEKEVKSEEKLLVKQLEKETREAEKEKKRMERELRKEKLHSEKKLKQLCEAEKDERHQEKDESETKKQLEDAEKSQRRREKEEAELKRKLSIQKQASMMERFLKKSNTNLLCQNVHPSSKADSSDSLSKNCERISNSVTLSMDHAISSNIEITNDDIRKLHVSSWRLLGHSIRSNKKQHWGMRRKPKTKLYEELRLTTNRLSCNYGLSVDVEKLENGWGEQTPGDGSCLTDIACSPGVRKYSKRNQLLQFDKSCRPAFYGVWLHKSHVVGARHPLRKDPDMDYDVDSDEEWEEEEPGESLSDCDKDDQDSLEEGLPKADDEDESEDGFFVPDGYLSENEGVEADKMETESSIEEPQSSRTHMEDWKTLDFCALVQQQKHLNNLTEHALRKSQPLFISNLMHEKVPLLAAEDLCGNSKLEWTCLQALAMRPFPTGPPVEISVDYMQAVDQDACPSNGKDGAVTVCTMDALPDSDIPTFVSAIHACSQSINKVVESLQQKFPTVPKTQLRNKVREISEFTENRWQVKKEIADKFGKSVSLEKSGKKSKSIASFFSKRCLPPADKSNIGHETPPQPSQKAKCGVGEEQICAYNNP